MTETRPLPSITTARARAPCRANTSAFGATPGVPLWAAILFAVMPTMAGPALDQMLFQQSAGSVSTVCFAVGCLLAVTLVQRRAVFGPMVHTPLVVSIALPLAMLLTTSSQDDGRRQVSIVTTSLITIFPAMVMTTAVVFGIGLVRMSVQSGSE